MAIYDPIVPRPKDVSGRDAGNMSDALQQALYQEMLRDELGRRPEGFAQAQTGREWRDLIPAIIGMLLLALLVLAVAYVAMLWRSGEFDGWSPSRAVTAAERQWRREDRVRPVEEPAPMVSEIDKMLEAQQEPPPQPAPKAEEAEE